LEVSQAARFPSLLIHRSTLALAMHPRPPYRRPRPPVTRLTSPNEHEDQNTLNEDSSQLPELPHFHFFSFLMKYLSGCAKTSDFISRRCAASHTWLMSFQRFL